MIVDSSALVAILRDEPERAAFTHELATARRLLRISAANCLEAAIVADNGGSPKLGPQLDVLITHLAIEIAPVTAEHARLARDAYRAFGKGNHPARPNYGDCFAYALSKAIGEPLLFNGDDFGHTDVLRAIA